MVLPGLARGHVALAVSVACAVRVVRALMVEGRP
jgi:hypothetical protein